MENEKEPKPRKKENQDEELIRGKLKDLYSDQEAFPASLSVRQAEELMARLRVLEARIAAGPEADPGTAVPAAAPAAALAVVEPAFPAVAVAPAEEKGGTPLPTAARRPAVRLNLRAKLILAIMATTLLALLISSGNSFYRIGLSNDYLTSLLGNSVSQQAESTLDTTASEQVATLNSFFAALSKDASDFAATAAQLLENQSTLNTGAYWNAPDSIYQMANGAWDNSNSDIVSIHIPAGQELTPLRISLLNTLVQLDFQAPSLLSSNPDIVAVYYGSESSETFYYPNIDLANIVGADFDVTGRPWYVAALPANNPGSGPVWSAPYLDAALNGLVITTSVPVLDPQGDFRGVAAMDIQLTQVTEIVGNIRVGESGYAFLIDPDKRLIAMPAAAYTSLGISGADFPLGNSLESPENTALVGPELRSILERMSLGESGLETVSIGGVEHYIVYKPVPEIGYSLAIVVPKQELLVTEAVANEELASFARSTTWSTFGIFAAAVLFAILGGLFFGNRLTRPLVELTRTAGEIGRGNLSARAEAKSGDEIGLLANTFNDMTAQLRGMVSGLEARVAERTYGLELASEVGRTITEKVSDQQEMLTSAAELIRSRFNLYYTQVYLLDAPGNNLVLNAGTGDFGRLLLQRGHRLPVSAASLNGRAVLERKAMIVEDTALSRTFLPNPLLPKTRSEMAIPLIASGCVIGVLDMQSETPGALNTGNLPAYEALAGQLSVAVQNAGLLADAQQARQDLESSLHRETTSGWRDFMNSIDKSAKIGYMFDQVTTVPVSEPAEAGSGLTQSITVTGAEIGMIQASGEDREWTAQDRSILEAAAARLGQHIDNLRLIAQAERYRAEAEEAVRRLTREGWEAYLQARQEMGYVFDQKDVLPLTAESAPASEAGAWRDLTIADETIGQLSLDTGDVSEQTMEILDTVAAQLSGHLENLRLSELNQKRAYDMQSVAELSATTSTVLDPDRLLQTIVDLTRERFGLYHAHIYTVNEAWKTLILTAGAGEVGRKMVAEEHTIASDAERSLVARAYRGHQAIIVNDVRSDPGFLPNPLLPETIAEMAVPMIVGDRVLGVFDVQSDQVNAFSSEDASIYTTLASQVAVALQNARLYVEQAATVNQLRELDRLKNSFLANMSHELRTPLNSILGFSDVILEELDGPLNENMGKDVRLIQKNGQHLLHLINDVLDMAKIEAGKMNIAVEKFKLVDVMEDVTSITSTLADQKGLELQIQPDTDRRIEIVADRTRIRQVLLNVVNNGIKFTNEGGVSMDAHRQGDEVRIRITDTGIAIHPDQLEVIFEEFTQVDTSSTRKAGGTGLGLPISRKLIEMHGGRLWAESTGVPGEGSTFIIVLPVEAHINPADLERKE